jgi:hypothetical protein
MFDGIHSITHHIDVALLLEGNLPACNEDVLLSIAVSWTNECKNLQQNG